MICMFVSHQPTIYIDVCRLIEDQKQQVNYMYATMHYYDRIGQLI